MCADFNAAFRKVFLGNSLNPSTDLDNGFLAKAGVASVNMLSTYGVGVFALVFENPKVVNGNYSVTYASAEVTGGKTLTLLSTSVYHNDKISPFIGGYQMTNKSKGINPKYVSKFYRVDPCLPNPNIIHIGYTNYTNTLSPEPSSCCHNFNCNQTYWLRVDVKGSPVLRYLTRNAYWTADAYTGCCVGVAGTTGLTATTTEIVDPTTVYIAWATGLLGQGTLGNSNFIPNKIVGPFLQITVFDTTGKAWYQPGSTTTPSTEWNNYVPLANTTAALKGCTVVGGWQAGMSIQGAYVDTQFGNCTFYPTDFFQKEPVSIYASETDQLGNPCVFTGICVQTQCCPRQGTGFGDTVLKDFILSESYSQNWFNTNLDLRIREVTDGYDISNAVTRNAFYFHYFILHNIPRNYNPTGVFDNDQYLLDIVTNNISPSFESTMTTWLNACGGSACATSLETFDCGGPCPCTSPIVLDTAHYTQTINGGAGSSFSNFYVSGGSGTTRTFVVSSGSLPNGLLLNATTGAITGATVDPPTNTVYQFSITATDNANCSTTNSYIWIVNH